MGTLAATQVLRMWERGAGRTPAGRALAILAEAETEVPPADLAALPLARRDLLLLDLRERLFGSRFAGVQSCVACGERLEFTFDADQLRPASGTGVPAAEDEPRQGDRTRHTLRSGQLDLELRLPDSTDLEAAAGCADVAAARALLAQRCVTAARRNGEPATAGELTEDAIGAIAGALEALDPVDTSVAVSCPACGTRSSMRFDIAAFLWAEIEAEALRLFHEVHRLARGYGWREPDILAMTPLRRRVYLELLPA